MLITICGLALALGHQILLPVTALDPKGRMCSNMAVPLINANGSGLTGRQASSATAGVAGGGEELRTQVLWALSIAMPFTLLLLASHSSLLLG